jgi:hypothetical protein
LAKTPTKKISPRVGFAFDLSGEGRRVVRGGYGMYFDQYTSSVRGDLNSQNKRPLNALATLTNTAIGVGQLATYRFGIDPPRRRRRKAIDCQSAPPVSGGIRRSPIRSRTTCMSVTPTSWRR